MKPTSDAFTMPCLSQACLLGYTPSPQHAFQGDAAHQVQRRTWLTPNDSPGAWYTRRDYRSSWTLYPFHRTVFTAHTWIALPFVEHNDMIEYVATETPDEPLAVGILPGPARGNLHLFDTQVFYSRLEGGTVDRVPVSQQVTGR
jgi:hypothetical protein